MDTILAISVCITFLMNKPFPNSNTNLINDMQITLMQEYQKSSK